MGKKKEKRHWPLESRGESKARSIQTGIFHEKSGAEYKALPLLLREKEMAKGRI